MQLIKKFQRISLIVFMTGFVLFSSQAYAQDLFVEYQSIPTQGGADCESFTIGSDTYLAVANNFNGTTYNIDSKIYKRYRAGFVEIQSIPTQGPGGWESFTIGTDTFLAVANRYDGSTWNIDSKIYRWNGRTGAFVEYQSIPTHCAIDCESFTIGSDTFLAVANHEDGSTRNIDSKIYKWDGSTFVEYQSIPTHGAANCESFTIGSATFLAVANWYNDSIFNIDSMIYSDLANMWSEIGSTVADLIREEATWVPRQDYLEHVIEMLNTYPPLWNLNYIVWSLYDIALNVTSADQQKALSSVFNDVVNIQLMPGLGSPLSKEYLDRLYPLNGGKCIAIQTVLNTVINVLTDARWGGIPMFQQWSLLTLYQR